MPPGNIPTDALDAAAKSLAFPMTAYDGAYDSILNDFNIDTIAGLANWGNGIVYTFWDIVVNYQVSPVGHFLTESVCQTLLSPGDEVLLAYMPIGPSWKGDKNPEVSFLTLSPTTVTVIDGRTARISKRGRRWCED